MTREIAIAVTIGLALLLLVLMLLSWRRRLRRDAGLAAPLGMPEGAVVSGRYEVLYVATTRHDEPLERLALKPLAYRARGEAALTDRGLAVSLDGAPTVFLAPERLIGAGRSTWTIDRVVEPGGLVRVVWRVDDGTPVDSYLRLIAADPAEFIERLGPLCRASETGASA